MFEIVLCMYVTKYIHTCLLRMLTLYVTKYIHTCLLRMLTLYVTKYIHTCLLRMLTLYVTKYIHTCLLRMLTLYVTKYIHTCLLRMLTLYVTKYIHTCFLRMLTFIYLWNPNSLLDQTERSLLSGVQTPDFGGTWFCRIKFFFSTVSCSLGIALQDSGGCQVISLEHFRILTLFQMAAR